jgi:L-threonylcarbamoyladenylate synthase
LISDLENLLNFAEVTSQKQLAFLKLIWPGPVSVILNLNSRAKKLLDQEEAAFRIPRNIFCQKLLKKIKLPLISTSVNRSGQEPLNNPEAIKKEFYEVDAIFYSEQKSLPAASTIIDLRCEKPVLVREGAINFVELFEKFK